MNNRWMGSGASYDVNGNQLTLPLRGFTYDGENRLTASTQPNSGAISYVYDGAGQRVQKTVGTAVTTYVYDGRGELAAEYGTPATTSGTEYLVADALRSTRLVLDAAGTPKERLDYLPFGEEIPSPNGGRGSLYSSGSYPSAPDIESQKFTGKERDAETGLDFFEARYYSGAQGRFTSVDPETLGGRMSDPQGWNGYAYARNNPLKFVDPDGRDYRVCDTQGKNCVNMNDQQYEDYLRNSPSIKQSPGRTLYNVNADGSWTKVGSATYFDPRAGNAAAFLDFSVKTLPAGYLSVLGPWLGLARTGTAAITVGLEGAAESANAVALVAREVSGVVSQATAAVGNQSVQVTSRAVAEKAADAFVGPGATPIVDRGTGQVVGKIS